MPGIAGVICLPALLATVSGQLHQSMPIPAEATESAAEARAPGTSDPSAEQANDELESTAVPAEDVGPRAGITLQRDTPIHLMVLSEVTTKTHSVGHRFRLRVNEPVVVDGIELIPVGATAWGEVTSAESSGNVGKSGKLQARLLHVEVGDRTIAIDGQTSDQGNSGTAETIMGVIGLGVFGLFTKGNNAKIKAGEKITAFTVDDVEMVPKADR